MASPLTQGRCAAATAGLCRLPALKGLRLGVLAITLMLGGPAWAQEKPPAAPNGEPAVGFKALCLTWSLAETAHKLADDLKALAADRVDQAGRRAAECKAKPECTQSTDGEKFERDLRDAGNQQAKVVQLAAAMEKRKTGIREHIEALHGKDALKKCGNP
ncbi:MAG: hypothetical protein ACREC6_10015 [Hyphomicrobiaceae bacterium]